MRISTIGYSMKQGVKNIGRNKIKTVIYSSEGFTDNEKNRPAIRVIDTVEKRQEEYCDLLSIGYNEEPEMIDFYRGRCLYSDACGSLYELSFER